VGAGFGEGFGHGEAEVPGSAGDEGDFAFEAEEFSYGGHGGSGRKVSGVGCQVSGREEGRRRKAEGKLWPFSGRAQDQGGRAREKAECGRMSVEGMAMLMLLSQ